MPSEKSVTVEAVTEEIIITEVFTWVGLPRFDVSSFSMWWRGSDQQSRIDTACRVHRGRPATEDFCRSAARHVFAPNPRAHGAIRDWPKPLGFLWGLQDPLGTTIVLDGLRAQRPAGPFVELPGLGHYPQIEDPRAYAEGALRLLNTN
jgi:pimeloyl-ACP methyl ester carboxylesterase